MNIILSHYPVVKSGGAECSTLDLGSSLLQKGHSIFLWGPWSNSEKFIEIARQNGLNVIERGTNNYIVELLKLRNICKKLQIDVIISSSRRYNLISYFLITI